MVHSSNRASKPVQHFDPETDGASDTKRKASGEWDGQGGESKKKRDAKPRARAGKESASAVDDSEGSGAPAAAVETPGGGGEAFVPARGELLREIFTAAREDVAHRVLGFLCTEPGWTWESEGGARAVCRVAQVSPPAKILCSFTPLWTRLYDSRWDTRIGLTTAPTREDYHERHNRKINIYVIDHTNEKVHFTAKMTTPLRKLMIAYCDRQGYDLNTMHFQFDGDALTQRWLTPEALGMEDGNIIDALLIQIGDIGTWGDHSSTTGVHILQGCDGTQNDASQIIEAFAPEVAEKHPNGVPPSHGLSSHPDAQLLTSEECEILMNHANAVCNGEDDFKLDLTLAELGGLIGQSATTLASFFREEYDAIKIRRTVPRGKCINFHVDHATRTMQIPLNAESCYTGGRLAFATHDQGIVWPSRRPGSATIHDDTVSHGVSTHTQGLRFGLFFLQHLNPETDGASDTKCRTSEGGGAVGAPVSRRRRGEM